jgi:hypothetical protein
MKPMQHGIAELVKRINAHATALGLDIRAEQYNLDNTWGDLDGLAITGSGDHDRVVAYASKYFAKHLAKLRSVSAQWAFGGASERQVFRSNHPNTAGKLFNVNHGRFHTPPTEPVFTATVLGLVYYPCAD